MAKVSVKLTRALRNFKEIRSEFNKKVLALIGGLIDAEIGKGLSPVAGMGRFQDYSNSYKHQITENEGVIRGTDGKLNIGKKLRPVNLYVSGTMRKSQKVEESETPNGPSVKVTYGSKFAAYHNAGVGKLPRRAILPTYKDEKFSRTIDRQVFEIAKKSIDKILSK